MYNILYIMSRWIYGATSFQIALKMYNYIVGRWKTLSSRVVHKNPWFSVREDKVVRPNGKNGVYYVVDKPSCVVIIPLTKKGEVYLIHIGRYTTGKSHWEIPIGSSDNQDELIAAKRELKEETGLVSKKWIKMGKLEVANGMSSQMSHVFAARDVKQSETKEKAIDEEIDRLQKVPFKKVLQMIKNNQIVDGPSVAALMLTGLKLKLL